MNTFGNIFRLTSFGESHGKAMGGIIDGCPSGFSLDLEMIQQELDRRRPGQSPLSTSRKEEDQVEFLSGLFEGKTTGTPIGFIIKNQDYNSSEYDNLKDIYRPSHADYTYQTKYSIRDYRGGGRSSARETVTRVVAGAIAKQILLEKENILIQAYTSQVETIKVEESYTDLDLSLRENNLVRCPNAEKALEMETLINKVKEDGDTLGGVVTCVCKNVPVGLGEPVYNKLQAALASAMLSINAAKGFDYGMGFEGIQYKGSKMNDSFYTKPDGSLGTTTNHSGGIQGGISNGEDIYFRVAFKPVPTLNKNKEGRHDSCVLPRAVPIVEAMAAMVLLDYYLLKNSYLK